MAKKLIDAVKESGADAVKFQTFKTENLAVKNSIKAEYQKKACPSNESQFEMLKKLELSRKDFENLFLYCNKKNITFLSSPFDCESADFLYNLGMNIFKIPSGEITNYLLLKKIGSMKKKVLLSTGMSYINEIKDAVNVLISNGTLKKNIIILHCNTEYPTPMEDVNLKAMLTIKNRSNINVGYSDHTLGIEVAIAAVALGAVVIEKHFTLDKNMKGPDHRASLEPAEFKFMVHAIRNIEKAIGDGIKQPASSELKNISIVRKSIIALREIKTGELFTENNIGIKRPGTGIKPMEWNKIIGRKSNKDYREDELIKI